MGGHLLFSPQQFFDMIPNDANGYTSLAAHSKPIDHGHLVIALWKAIKQIENSQQVILDGDSLTVAHVAAIAKQTTCHGLLARDAGKIENSVRILQDKLKKGDTIYGVNTGYGGSADVRCESREMHTLQRAFLQHLHCGVTQSDSMDAEWVRAAMIIRANTVSRGHSAVRLTTIKLLLDCLNANIIPLIPTRGSISASGDLSPLSYIAGLLEGNPDIYCIVRDQKIDERNLLPANRALEMIGIRPITFEPKEALGLVNGTAVSCAVGSLALKSMHHLLALSQLVTAMNVEALSGTTASFVPFISAVRPHPGQRQVAATILTALKGSKIATDGMKQGSHTLFQDRYSLRTVPQWLGPFVEDLLLAHEQITTELNSTTDNPLIDPETGRVHHGGNFQAVSVTSAMEKCRLAAQAIGRMLFSQFTELCNPATNRGLPPNLCADEPSTSFTMKGLDVHMAGYMSELAFLANPVHSHVVNAEMGNQALNSLALISARYTEQSVEILTLMSASAIYGACQALDLRAILQSLESPLRIQISDIFDKYFGDSIKDEGFSTKAKASIWDHVKSELGITTNLDTKERFETIFHGAKATMIDVLDAYARLDLAAKLREWSHESAESAEALYRQASHFLLFTDKNAPQELFGQGAKRLYEYVRNRLQVPFHKGVQDHPAPVLPVSSSLNGELGSPNGAKDTALNEGQEQKRTIGHWVGVIYQAIKNDDIMDVVIECLEDVVRERIEPKS